MVKYTNTESGDNDIGTLYAVEDIVGAEVSTIKRDRPLGELPNNVT